MISDFENVHDDEANQRFIEDIKKNHVPFQPNVKAGVWKKDLLENDLRDLYNWKKDYPKITFTSDLWVVFEQYT